MKYTKEKFIEKANKIYNNFYDYSLVNFIYIQTKVEIICPIHGKFEKEPTYHTNKTQGCPKCGNLKRAKSKKMPLQEYINKVSKIHNNFYDYSLVEFENIHDIIKIICPVHGIIEMKASNHLHNKSKCKYCVNNNLKSNTVDFIKKSKKIHGEKYDYSLVEYIDNKTDIKLIYDGDVYKQNPKSHLKGMNINITSIVNITIEEKLLKVFNYIHNKKYKYTEFKYSGFDTIIDIICPIHGLFKQKINLHLNGSGCQICKTSKGELEIQKILDNKNIKYITQHKFDDCKNKYKLPFDFYLPELNMCIEYDGLQHYETIKYWGGDKKLKDTQLRDKIKTEYCINNNIQLIRIRYDENIEEKLRNIF